MLLCLINLAFLNPQVLNWDKIFVSQFTKIKVGALPDVLTSLTLFNNNLINLTESAVNRITLTMSSITLLQDKANYSEDASTPTTESLWKMTWKEKR